MAQNIICENSYYILHTVGQVMQVISSETTTGTGEAWKCKHCGAKVFLAKVTR